MTRETKIGLLVGLAFIIVVAILLTDHTTSTTEPRPAAQSDIGDNVRQSVTTPQPKIPTREDLARPPVEPARPRPPVRIAQGERENPPAPLDIRQTGDAGEPSPRPPVVADAGNAGNAAPPVGRPGDLVSQHPEELMSVGGIGRTSIPPPPPGPAKPPVVQPKTYVAEAGDSVSRIASRQMPGGNTSANRDALIKANPSLQAEGNPVYVGKTYVIPSVGAVAQATDAARKESAHREPAFRKPPASTPTTYWYTVKENDNLWRIAASELGDGNLWPQIKELNADVLRGGETVKANQRIRLPKGGASTASVN